VLEVKKLRVLIHRCVYVVGIEPFQQINLLVEGALSPFFVRIKLILEVLVLHCQHPLKGGQEVTGIYLYIRFLLKNFLCVILT
jgi:hypothetical protein